MRVGPIIAGSILLIIGLAAVVGGGMLRDVGDWCVQTRCDDGDALMMGMVGSGVFMGGALAGLAGIGLIVAGVLAESPRATTAPIAVPMRACPSCGVDGPGDAKYCASCGAAVAPTLHA